VGDAASRAVQWLATYGSSVAGATSLSLSLSLGRIFEVVAGFLLKNAKHAVILRRISPRANDGFRDAARIRGSHGAAILQWCAIY